MFRRREASKATNRCGSGCCLIVGIAVETPYGHGLTKRPTTRTKRRRRWIADWVPGLVFWCGPPLLRTTRQSSNSQQPTQSV